MASSMAAIMSVHIPPFSQARSKSTTRKPYHKKHRSPNPNPPPLKQLKTPSIGTDATTFTRLPPKDDFLIDSVFESAAVLKLSDITPPKISEQNLLIGNDLGLDYAQFEASDDESYISGEEGDDLGENFEFEEGEVVQFGDNEGFMEGGDVDDDEEAKEKGVPAVMRCFDRAKVFAKAGDGGNGVVAFRREKYVPFGGPSGGDGGRGGNVYVEVDGSMNSLLPFRNGIHFRAGRGSHGQGSKMAGAKGEDVVIKVAPGTVIREAVKDDAQGEVLLELLHPGQRALLLPGGRGGRGNASFKSGTNKVPRIAENGEEGPEM